jgi:dipeptidyl aminopeptidase/acylaminoacyl peptidase
MEETLDLVRVFQQKGTVFHRSGVLLSAFRSPMDSTLQPFSIYLPENFDPGKTYHLMVALHGSGVDEQGFIRYFSGNYSREDLIVLAPRGRHLSAWYLGDTERDVADLVRLVQNMFSVDRTFLFGFSMGGYGVWRMGFLHEALFDAAVCVSGPPLPWVDNRPENDMRNHIGKGKSIRYLVFHGTEDHAVDITDTDDFMEKLKENGYNVTYIRVPGAGHGNFSFGEIMVKWLGENIFQ